MSNIDLLPRADLPVIWEDFKSKAALCRDTAESLVVTDVSQKESMALARKTRLTLREIRIAVEHKRVELGEGHLKEIQKVNGAAKAIREFIEPLEARLLVQETFAERAEANRIADLAIARYNEAAALRPHFMGANMGKMLQEDFDDLIANLKQEKAELEAANRLRIEAERKLAEAQAEAQAVAERQRKEIAAILNAKLEAQRKESEALELKRRAEYEAQRKEYELKAEAARILAQQERDAANLKAQQEQERLDAEKAVRDADAAEQKRIRDEQYAALEAELKVERAVKLAEVEAARKLALAPDVEKLRAFSDFLVGIARPDLTTPEAIAVLNKSAAHFAAALFVIDTFCRE